ncbi:metal-dependent hydrolase [Clostridiaceae bacterium 35-E11]
MNGKTHILFGSVASLYILPKLGYEPTLTTVAAAILGSLIPDIDHPRAKINQIVLPMKNKFGKMLFYSGIGFFLLKHYGLENKVILSISILLILIGFSQHRSFTHSIVGTLFISAVIFSSLKNVISYSIIMSFITGLVSHLIGDWMTVEGIRLFYPFLHKRYRFVVVIASGTMAEPLICMFLIYLIFNFYV